MPTRVRPFINSLFGVNKTSKVHTVQQKRFYTWKYIGKSYYKN